MLEHLFGTLIPFLLSGLYELGFRSVARLRPMERFRQKPRPWVAATWYAIFGIAAGDISLFLMPARWFYGWPSLAVALVVPLLTGVVAYLISGWHKARFACGYLFALAFILLRYWLAT